MTETRPDLHPRTIGPYRLGQRLGAGGMGAVYRAFDERLERFVALKQIRPDVEESPRARKRFRREARSAARLSHPGIVRVHDFLEAEGCDWIVMELVEGQPLAQLLDRGPLPLKRALGLAAEITEALAAAHAEGIVHRDLKAKNVLVTLDDHAKVLDFGLAKQVLQRDGKSTSISVEGQLLGTPQAMSPEQAMGRKVDPRSDLFSLGSLLYELVTGVAPFRASSPLESMTRVCTHHPPPVREHAPSLPRSLEELIERLLQKDPVHRPATAGEVALELRRMAACPLPEEPPEGDPQGLGANTAIEPEGVSSPTTVERQTPSEVRQVTVMSCELTSGDPSSASLDPEAVYHVTAGFEDLAREVIGRFEGHVANALGHRLVVCFGYPRAQEDAAQRAANAAQALQDHFVVSRADTGAPSGLALRIGIHTGLAVILGDSAEGWLALGQTLDVATALQRRAAPGVVLISDTVRRLLSKTHGVEETPVPVGETTTFRLLNGRATSGSWQVATTPLVARQREIDLLLDRFERARGGTGQVVFLSGEAGIGKSRVVGALENRLESEQTPWLVAQGSPFTNASPLQPFIDLLQRLFGLVQETSAEPETSPSIPEEPLRRLADCLSQHGLDPDEATPLFATLLALPFEGIYPPLEVTPQKQREMTLQALVTLFLGMAHTSPVTLVVEDLHWIDPSTLDLLDRLIDRCHASSLLLLLTSRPELEPPWGEHDHLTQLHLSRLTGSEAAALIDRVTGGKSLPDQVRDQIVAKTDGIPLFVEELTRNLIESGLLTEEGNSYVLQGPLDSLMIPATLRDSLTARLDRLGTAKEVAQIGATIGREFSFQLLAAVSPLTEQGLRTELRRLVTAQLVYQKGFSSRQRYLFKHALIQDAAYDSILKRQRQAYHRKIADVLETTFTQVAERQPEILAHHYTEANLPQKGVRYWKRAGQRNFQGSAIVEAKKYLDKGLAITSTLTSGDDRRRQELELQTTLAEVLSNLEGIASPNAAQAYQRAIEIAEESGNTSKLFWALLGLSRGYIAQGRYEESLRYAQRLRKVAPTEDHIRAIFANQQIGCAHYFRGEHEAARRSLDQALRHDDDQRRKPYLGPHAGQDPGAVTLHYASVNAWIMGYFDRARELAERSVALAKQISHTYTLTYAMTGSAVLSQCLREPKKTLERAQEAITLSLKQGSWWHAMAAIYQDWARASLDTKDAEKSIQSLRHRIDTYITLGLKAMVTQFLTMLIDVSLRRGLFHVAGAALDQACTTMRETGEGHFEAEIYRLRGEWKLTDGFTATGHDHRMQSAEHEFIRAIEIAQRRRSKTLELRATVSLGRLWVGQGRISEARELVAATYGWFSEGSDTTDLVEAEAFLKGLSES